jgi:hypothetical protein
MRVPQLAAWKGVHGSALRRPASVRRHARRNLTDRGSPVLSGGEVQVQMSLRVPGPDRANPLEELSLAQLQRRSIKADVERSTAQGFLLDVRYEIVPIRMLDVRVDS